jgi:hypothetical protein
LLRWVRTTKNWINQPFREKKADEKDIIPAGVFRADVIGRHGMGRREDDQAGRHRRTDRRYARRGRILSNAAEMAVKEINAAGGLQVGKEKMKVELVVEDNAGKADQSAAAAQKLITQDEVRRLSVPTPAVTRFPLRKSPKVQKRC